MRIIHFSDFHLDIGNLKDFEFIVNQLKCIIKKINGEKPIDLILFTGDMINQGGKSFNNNISLAFDKFKSLFIDSLCESICLNHNRFIFTMGNHDVFRKKDCEPMELGLSQMFENLTSVNKIINNEDKDNYIKRIVDFKNFEKEYFEKYKPFDYKHSKFCSNFKLCIDDNIVGISALNTAWRCWNSENDKNKILMGSSQIQNSLEFLAPCELKIAISHHHYSWLHPKEFDLIQSLLFENYDMYFYGHIHCPQSGFINLPNAKIFEMSAPGILSENINISDNQYKNGFGVVDYDFKNQKFEVSRYYQEKGRFTKDYNFGGDGNGIWTLYAHKSINLMKRANCALSNIATVNQEIDSYIQSPLEYVNEILQGNQVPTFKPDDSYQDVIYDDKIEYIVAITAENPNLFLDPTIGFYMSNCYAVSLIRHVNDFIKKNHQDNPNKIPQLKTCHLEDFTDKIDKDRQTIIDNLKNKQVFENFDFIRFFIYDKKQGECCDKAVFPSLKASQDLFRSLSFYIQKEELKDKLSEQDWKEKPPKLLKLGKEKNKWERLHEINKKILELYNKFCNKNIKAKEVQKDRIEKTIPEYLFVFYKDTIGIHTYLGGVYYRIPKVRLNDDNGKLIKELIKLLTEYVDKDDAKGQLALAANQLNNKNTYIICEWSDSSEDGVVNVQL